MIQRITALNLLTRLPGRASLLRVGALPNSRANGPENQQHTLTLSTEFLSVSKSFDAHFENISGYEQYPRLTKDSNAIRCAGRNYVAGLECDSLRAGGEKFKPGH